MASRVSVLQFENCVKAYVFDLTTTGRPGMGVGTGIRFEGLLWLDHILLELWTVDRSRSNLCRFQSSTYLLEDIDNTRTFQQISATLAAKLAVALDAQWAGVSKAEWAESVDLPSSPRAECIETR
jgi:hypothetical protein